MLLHISATIKESFLCAKIFHCAVADRQTARRPLFIPPRASQMKQWKIVRPLLTCPLFPSHYYCVLPSFYTSSLSYHDGNRRRSLSLSARNWPSFLSLSFYALFVYFFFFRFFLFCWLCVCVCVCSTFFRFWWIRQVCLADCLARSLSVCNPREKKKRKRRPRWAGIIQYHISFLGVFLLLFFLSLSTCLDPLFSGPFITYAESV